MALYEIRTMLARGRTSLVSYGDFLSHTSAIMAALDLLRIGESVEVWRDNVLIYRSGSNVVWLEATMFRSRSLANRQANKP